MKFSMFKNALFSLAAIAMVTVFGTSCGNTMYGMGLDMESTGRRLQNNHDPNAGASQDYYGAPQAPAAPSGYGGSGYGGSGYGGSGY